MQKEKEALAKSSSGFDISPAPTMPKRESPMKYILIILFSVLFVLLASFLIYTSFSPKTHTDSEFIQSSAVSPWFSASNGAVSLNPDYEGSLPRVLIIPQSFDGLQIKSIAENAFAECSGIEKIILPDQIKEIGKGAFKNIKSLKEAELGKIEEINSDTFSGCSNLERVSCESARVIYQRAFLGCEKLSELSAPSVTSVGASSFEGCKSLASFEVKGISKFGEKAFSSTSSLSAITIKDNARLGAEAFSYSGIEKVTFSGSASIEKGAFKGCERLTDISLPQSLTSLPSELFYGCTSLKSFTVDENITILGDNVFCGCTSLENVEIKAKIKKIPAGTFDSCYNLKSLTYPDSVTEIGNRAFAYSGISETFINANIEVIGNSAYEGCNNLKSISIPFGVKVLGFRAFADSDNLESISFPTTLIEIGESAFESCGSITEFKIPPTVTSLGDSVLRECTNLKTLYLYTQNANVTGRLTEGCKSLEKIETSGFSEKYTSVDGVLLSKDKTRIIIFPANHQNKSYTAPSTVTSIDAYAFIHSNIEKITLSNVEIIGMSAFEGCTRLREASAELSSHIGYGAFKDCENLTEILFSNALSQIDGDAFSGCSSLKEVTLPSSAYISDNSFPSTTEKSYFETEE